ncbi:MAG: hypothetical protein EAY75_02550 [Bacteroidetes bacterium]|nr:MAG: hypothetical protein EAY75_02550 [Bacteroidota bacterium]
MKKMLSALLVLCTLHGLSQTEKSSFLVGGGLGLKTGENNSQFSIDPNFGYFFFDNFAAGANLRLNFSKAGAVRENELGIGPFARYYFGQASTRPFLVSEFDLLTSTFKSGSLKSKNNGWGFLFGLGFAAFITDNVAVEGVSGYNFSKYKDFEGDGGFSLRLGFQLYFNNSSVKRLKTNVMGR